MSVHAYAHASSCDLSELTRRLGTLPADRWVLTGVPALRGRIGPLEHLLIGPPGLFALAVVRLPGTPADPRPRGALERRRGSLAREVLRDTRAVQGRLSRALGRIVVTRGVLVVADGPLRRDPVPTGLDVIAGDDVPGWFSRQASASLSARDVAALARAART